MTPLPYLQEYKINLDIFEGPMDLLLHLIKKAKIDIYDIPIALITEQYLEYIRIMQDLNLDVAGDFLVMASYLLYLKSRSLLNAGLDEEEEDCEESKRKLAQRLIEYQTFKKGAEILSTYEMQRRKTIPSTGIPIPNEEGTLEADLFDLLKAYYEAVKDKIHPTQKHRVTIDPIIVQEEISRILSVLRVKKKMFFRLLLKNSEKRHLIIDFLAVLELARTQKIKIFQTKHFGDILVQYCL